MTYTQVGDVVLYLRSERRAVTDAVDAHASQGGTDLFHLAEQDVTVTEASFINVTRVCRDIAELAALFTDLDQRLATLAHVVDGIDKTLKALDYDRTPAARKGSSRAKAQ